MPEVRLKETTTCRVCGQPFQAWRLDAQLPGQQPSDETKNFVKALAKHLATKHPEKWQAIQVGGESFIGMLILMVYTSTDPHLNKQIEEVRTGVQGLLNSEPSRIVSV